MAVTFIKCNGHVNRIAMSRDHVANVNLIDTPVCMEFN